jgi:hypothetical protein
MGTAVRVIWRGVQLRLADALASLGACYREVGRHQDAIAAGEEAASFR